MNETRRYAKIVEWSEEDQCYIGSVPGLITGGSHGDDERKVFDELCEIVEEVVEIYKQDGRELPPATTGLIDRLEDQDRAKAGAQRRAAE